jgi:hypothetical protein
MTTPDTGSPRPGRIAGVALLGLAAVALIIGLITALGGNGDGRADGNHGEPTQTTASRTGTIRPTDRPPTTSKSSPPKTTTTTTTPAPGTSSSQPPGGDGNGEPTKSVPVRVLNNSKIKGLAAKAAADLEADGWNVVFKGNYSATNVPTTTVYYRPGTDEEATARAIATAFGLDVAPRIKTLEKEPAGVIVIVTNDYGDTNGDGKGNEGS